MLPPSRGKPPRAQTYDGRRARRARQREQLRQNRRSTVSDARHLSSAPGCRAAAASGASSWARAWWGGGGGAGASRRVDQRTNLLCPRLLGAGSRLSPLAQAHTQRHVAACVSAFDVVIASGSSREARSRRGAGVCSGSSSLRETAKRPADQESHGDFCKTLRSGASLLLFVSAMSRCAGRVISLVELKALSQWEHMKHPSHFVQCSWKQQLTYSLMVLFCFSKFIYWFIFASSAQRLRISAACETC